MNVLCVIGKSEETNIFLNYEQNKNRCDAMVGITYVLVDLVIRNINYFSL